jgi:hypothetical protein
MAISLCWCIQFAAGDSRRAWQNRNLDPIAVLRDRLIGGWAIIRTVRGHLNNRIVNLIEQRADPGRIVGGMIVAQTLTDQDGPYSASSVRS